ncbi:TPA: hypothetical protein ACH58E_000787 [Escherichia coli]
MLLLWFLLKLLSWLLCGDKESRQATSGFVIVKPYHLEVAH